MVAVAAVAEVSACDRASLVEAAACGAARGGGSRQVVAAAVAAAVRVVSGLTAADEADLRLEAVRPHLQQLLQGKQPSGAQRKKRNAALHVATGGGRLGHGGDSGGSTSCSHGSDCAADEASSPCQHFDISSVDGVEFVDTPAPALACRVAGVEASLSCLWATMAALEKVVAVPLAVPMTQPMHAKVVEAPQVQQHHAPMGQPMHEKAVEAPQAHQRHVPLDMSMRTAEEVPQVEFFDTAALETPRVSQPYVPMVQPMHEIVMEAPQVHQRYVPMVQPMHVHQRRVPMAAQVSSSPVAVGDVVVIVWPSHRAHGHKGRVASIYDDGKFEVATE